MARGTPDESTPTEDLAGRDAERYKAHSRKRRARSGRRGADLVNVHRQRSWGNPEKSALALVRLETVRTEPNPFAPGVGEVA